MTENAVNGYRATVYGWPRDASRRALASWGWPRTVNRSPWTAC